jgi:hypothetical protein
MGLDLLKMLQDLVTKLSELQAQLAEASFALEGAKKVSYDEGFQAGIASVIIPVIPSSDKIYSEAELQAKIAEAVLPLQAQLDAMPKAIVDAVAAVKAELLMKYSDLEVAMSTMETGFAELLK